MYGDAFGLTPLFHDRSFAPMRDMSRPSKVFFWQGYTVDAQGISCWPFRGHRYRWSDLERFEYAPYAYNGRGMFRLRLFFAPGAKRKARLECGAGVRNLAKIVHVLRWMREVHPKHEGWQDTRFDELLRAGEVLDSWAPIVGTLPDEALFQQAKIRMAALEWKAAIKDCRTLILRRSDCECRAARLKIEAELAAWKTEEALDTLADLLSRHPEEIQARAMVASYLINVDDARGPAMACAVFDRNPAEFPSLVLNCAAYAVRRKRWDEAEELLGRLERERARLGEPEKDALDRYRADLAELRTDPRRAFRVLTLGKLRAVLPVYALMLIPLLLFAWPFFHAGPIFARESWNLWQLRAHGVRAEVVREVTQAPSIAS